MLNISRLGLYICGAARACATVGRGFWPKLKLILRALRTTQCATWQSLLQGLSNRVADDGV